MDYINLPVAYRKLFLVTIVAGLTSQSVNADYDCVKLDPRVKLSEQTEVEVSGNAETVYKIAKAGGKVTIEAKSAAQNVQESVPISEAGNAQNRLLYLLCEMMSKDDIPTDKKIELYKYVTDKISPGTGAGNSPAGEVAKSVTDTPTKKNDAPLSKSADKKPPMPKASEAVVKKVISDPKVKVDIYSGALPRGAQENRKPAFDSSGSAPSAQQIGTRNNEPPRILTFNEDCKQELGFQYAKYKQTAVGSKFSSFFIHVRNNKLFRCDECVDNLTKFIASKTDIPLSANIGVGWGAPGCIGYREDIGGSLKGALCLQALLGDNYKVNKSDCSMDGFPYPVKLRQ